VTARLAPLGCALLCACAAPWQVVRQADPNPFAGAREFGLEPVGFDGLRVGDGAEAAWLGGKDAAEVAAWHEGKAALESEMRAGLAGAVRGHPLLEPGAARWSLRPNVTFIEPSVTKVELTLSIVDAARDAVLDQVRFECVEKPGRTSGLMVSQVPTGQSVGERVRACGRRLGEAVAAYVKDRTGVE
jgi:hypothetical protein